MSTSAACLLKDNEHEIESDRQTKPTSEKPDDSHPTAMDDKVAEPHRRITGKIQQENNDVDRGLRTSSKQCEVQSKEEEEGEEDKVEDDNEGFRTPTSLACKIPTVQKCPAAPRKPKTLTPPTRNDSVRSMPVFLSDDMAGWVISSSILLDLQHKIKKPRKLKAD